MKQSVNIDRRSLVTAGTAIALGAAAGTASLAHADEQAPAAYDATVPASWDRTCEILVLGLGIAGTCALLEAYELGADVIGVDAAANIVDCSCTRSGGWFCGVGSAIQVADGIDDDVETFVDDIRRDGGDAGDPELIRAWGEQSGETIDWLQSMGCDVVQQTFDARETAGSDSHSAARDYITNPVGSGIGWMMGLEAAVKERGIDVLWSTKATKLYRNAGGRVVGALVEAMDGSGAQNIEATKGVVLAMGGLGRNLDAHVEFTPSMREVANEASMVLFSCSENSLGNGFFMARDIDAYVFNSPPTQASAIQMNDHDEAYPNGWLHFILSHTQGLVEVNANGERFNDETSFEDYYNKKMALKQPHMQSFQIIDEAGRTSADGQTYAQGAIDAVEASGCGSIVHADTLEEIADMFGIPQDALVAAVSDYNAHVDSQEPDEFGRTIFPAKIETPPFWCARTDVVLGISKGGCKINANAQVIDTKGAPIPGLYAAGEMAFAQLHGDARTHIVGGPNSSAAVYGRIAARSAANEA